MKICFVTTSYIRSASDHYARFVHEQAKSLLDADADASVIVVAPMAPGLPRDESVDGVRILRATYFWPTQFQSLAYQHEGLFATVRRSGLAALQLPVLLCALAARLWSAARGADVIHAQWLPTSVVAIAVGSARRIPVVASVRGADLNSGDSRIGRAFLGALLRRLDAVVTVSDEFKQRLERDFSGCRIVRAIHNGVDGEQFKPRSIDTCRVSIGLDPQSTVVLYVGGLIERKDVGTLLRSMVEVAAGTRPAELYLAGEGPQEHSLRTLARNLGLADRVHFLGAVSRDSIHLWMGAADVLVLPSLGEGRPNVVIEALACGTPVVATDINGTRELVSGVDDGLLFRPGDASGLAHCLNRVLNDAVLARRLAEGGPRRIEELGLTWRAHGRKLMDLYRLVQGGN